MTTSQWSRAVPRRVAYLLCGIVGLVLGSTVSWAEQDAKPVPTHAHVAYGPHERNVLDFWRADSTEPTPLVLYIHGGGFRNGSKENLNRGVLVRLLEAGISVAAINYRLLPEHRLPAAQEDSRRAMQFLRSRGRAWNIDTRRMGVFGGSAGAQLSMYLAFHDDMATPDSADPIERESTRVACVATSGGQATMDTRWWLQWVPGYTVTPDSRRQSFFDVDDGDEEKLVTLVEDLAALNLISSDDPPIFMSYGMAPDAEPPSDPNRVRGWMIHHVIFGVKLKEQMDTLQIEADLKYPGSTGKYRSNVDFFIDKLTKTNR